jgi:hypothetical protein
VFRLAERQQVGTKGMRGNAASEFTAEQLVVQAIVVGKLVGIERLEALEIRMPVRLPPFDRPRALVGPLVIITAIAECGRPDRIGS